MADNQKIKIGLIGLGTVGGGVAELLNTQQATYTQRLGGKRLELARVLVRNVDKARKLNIVAPDLLTSDAEDFFTSQHLDVVVEVAGGVEPIGQLVERALKSSCHVVTANKSLLAAKGPELFALAKQNNVAIAFEASCGGGIPIVTALKFGLMANNFKAMYGILNGTCNYILTEMIKRGKTYQVALDEAQEKGFAEADPTMDVGGHDAAQKLAILASLAFGCSVQESQVACEGIASLTLDDIRFGAELGYDIKLLAIVQQNDAGELDLRVQPCFIDREEPLAQVHGSFNALSVYGHATGHSMYFGRGAGKLPTASAVVSDILNIASGWYATAFAEMNLWPNDKKIANLANPAQLESRFYLKLQLLDVPGVMGRVASLLGDAGVSISAILQHEVDDGHMVPVVIATHQTTWGAVQEACAKISAMESAGEKPVVIRIVDFPEG